MNWNRRVNLCKWHIEIHQASAGLYYIFISTRTNAWEQVIYTEGYIFIVGKASKKVIINGTADTLHGAANKATFTAFTSFLAIFDLLSVLGLINI